jgi:5-methylthioribose kinase
LSSLLDFPPKAISVFSKEGCGRDSMRREFQHDCLFHKTKMIVSYIRSRKIELWKKQRNTYRKTKNVF